MLPTLTADGLRVLLLEGTDYQGRVVRVRQTIERIHSESLGEFVIILSLTGFET